MALPRFAPNSANGIHQVVMRQNLRRAIFLDRDGVINRSRVIDGKAYAPRRLEDFRLLPGVRNAMLDLTTAGFVLVVVTNQPDIGNALVEASVVEAMNDRLRRETPVMDIYCCPHSQKVKCDCRKPAPGMLLMAAHEHGIALSASYMVGDRPSDVECGRRAGCKTVFIDRGYREILGESADLVASSLPQATRLILSDSMIELNAGAGLQSF